MAVREVEHHPGVAEEEAEGAEGMLSVEPRRSSRRTQRQARTRLSTRTGSQVEQTRTTTAKRTLGANGSTKSLRGTSLRRYVRPAAKASEEDERELTSFPLSFLYRSRQLHVLREQERKQAIANGEIDDPDNPNAPKRVGSLKGTCVEMCPRYEREEREHKFNVDRLELVSPPRLLPVSGIIADLLPSFQLLARWYHQSDRPLESRKDVPSSSSRKRTSPPV